MRLLARQRGRRQARASENPMKRFRRIPLGIPVEAAPDSQALPGRLPAIRLTVTFRFSKGPPLQSSVMLREIRARSGPMWSAPGGM